MVRHPDFYKVSVFMRYTPSGIVIWGRIKYVLFFKCISGSGALIVYAFLPMELIRKPPAKMMFISEPDQKESESRNIPIPGMYV
jgi:hypothetical protein